jgi:hypothetical protein
MHLNLDEMIMKTLCVALMLVAVTSCSSTTDITNNAARMTDFVFGQTYELKKPAYVWKGRLMPRELADSEATLASGTILAIRKVEVDHSPEMGTITDVFAEVVAGQSKGRVVNVTWISEVLKTGYTKRNPEMLQPVEGETK